ncbi:MAG: hypothetical protein CM1200mP41_14350 [Gammaproteobacteria bacterium]|nr:MAG: hypothetical protein CM1200mP41_14350 [Gammaproteobacteria bacterium]
MYTAAELQTILPRADFVLISAPHTTETDRAHGGGRVGFDKRAGPGKLVNYSRAGLVDYEGCEFGLKRGEQRARSWMCLRRNRCRTHSLLWEASNLLITPHCSSDDESYYTPRTLDLVFENARRLIQGKPYTIE